MQKITIANMEFQFEKVNAENFKRGAAAFRVIDKDGQESFWVNAPATIGAFNDGVATPNDGRMVAFCHSEDDAEMVAAAINISIVVANAKKDSIDAEVKKLADALGIDTDKLQEEVDRLKAEGKSAKEIGEILKPRMEEFKTKKDATPKERGQW